MGVSVLESDAKTSKPGFQFPGAVTTLAIVVVLVWVAALFIPSGRYLTDADGSPIPGSYERTPSPLGVTETIQQLVLAPINGIYGLRSISTETIDTEVVGRIFGQIGIFLIILRIPRFTFFTYATRFR